MNNINVWELAKRVSKLNDYTCKELFKCNNKIEVFEKFSFAEVFNILDDYDKKRLEKTEVNVSKDKVQKIWEKHFLFVYYDKNEMFVVKDILKGMSTKFATSENTEYTDEWIRDYCKKMEEETGHVIYVIEEHRERYL